MLNLAPARWIWLPCGRTLPNTVVRFRLDFRLDQAPKQAVGWILADSRYRLFVNGQRVQWGPGPADPRWPEADPLDLSHVLRAGDNVIGVEVLFFGYGEGTWADGNPGLIVQLVVDGVRRDSNSTWHCALDRSHTPGQHQQWFLRALQEDVDARLIPTGWAAPGFFEDHTWMPARELGIPADKSTIHPHTCSISDPVCAEDPSILAIRERSVPLLREEWMPANALVEQGRVTWHRDPADWFDCRIAGSLTATREIIAASTAADGWHVPATPEKTGWFLTYTVSEQAVGWPCIEIDAPAGTIVEVMLHEAHDLAADPWLETHFNSWFRWRCAAGINHIEPFDFFGLRWIQVHIRNASGPVHIRAVGLRRRLHPWPHEGHLLIGETGLQKLVAASFNTLRNSVQETICDGFGRERQQYSGDCGHQLHAIRQLHGGYAVCERYLRTWGEGQTADGWFLDCWPGYDRLKRIAQRQIGGTQWGPLLDHGVGYGFDVWHHLLETGDRAAVAVPYQRLLRFGAWLWTRRDATGMIPASGHGLPSVWIDHHGFNQQRHKDLSFTLYIAAMFGHALAKLADFFEPHTATTWRERSVALAAVARQRHWCPTRRLFVDNLPWLAEEGGMRLHDRSLATSVLFDFAPEIGPTLDVLEKAPSEMGLSYPANAGWRLWALSKGGRSLAVLNELRQRWATLASVHSNNSLSENWHPQPDSCDQWSHCPVVPLYLMSQDIAGIRATSPGFATCSITPQLGDLPSLGVTVHTPHGPIFFRSERHADGQHITLEIPPGVQASFAGSPLVAGRSQHLITA